MADQTFSADIQGLRETAEKMEQPVRDLRGEPLLQGMRDATLLVQGTARTLAPVDTGRLRASIMPEVRSDPLTGSITGVVGSNVDYAPYVELGTKPHFPPLAALEVWAARHGTTARAVAMAIARRGTKAVKYLQNAVEQNESKIVALIGDAVSKIVEQ